MGFCLYSTVGIAAKACAKLCHRVLVFDWDVPHGNGTQDCLYEGPNTCLSSYISRRSTQAPAMLTSAELDLGKDFLVWRRPVFIEGRFSSARYLR